MTRSDQPESLAGQSQATVLIFSDSHGSSSFLLRTAARHPDADLVIHLGDHGNLLSELSRQCPIPMKGVAGNCDGWHGRHLPSTLLLEIAGRRVFLSHGHHYGVKNQLDKLIKAGSASPYHADVILFGHTHQALERTIAADGRQILLVNPGSCRTGSFSQPASAVIMQFLPDRINVDFLLDLP